MKTVLTSASLVLATALVSAPAFAGAATVISEPGVLGMVAAAAVAGVIVYRLRKRK